MFRGKSIKKKLQLYGWLADHTKNLEIIYTASSSAVINYIMFIYKHNIVNHGRTTSSVNYL